MYLYISVPGYLLTMGNATSRDPVGLCHSPARPASSVHRIPPYTPPSDKPLILFINPQRGINIAPSPQHARGERDVVNDGNTFAASTGIRECGRRTFNSTLSTLRLLPAPVANPSSLLDLPIRVGFSVCIYLFLSLRVVSVGPNAVECRVKLVLNPRLIPWNAMSTLWQDISKSREGEESCISRC